MDNGSIYYSVKEWREGVERRSGSGFVDRGSVQVRMKEVRESCERMFLLLKRTNEKKKAFWLAWRYEEKERGV